MEKVKSRKLLSATGKNQNMSHMAPEQSFGVKSNAHSYKVSVLPQMRNRTRVWLAQ
jgi:hypothetical protein